MTVSPTARLERVQEALQEVQLMKARSVFACHNVDCSGNKAALITSDFACHNVDCSGNKAALITSDFAYRNVDFFRQKSGPNHLGLCVSKCGMFPATKWP